MYLNTEEEGIDILNYLKKKLHSIIIKISTFYFIYTHIYTHTPLH